jgi:hypothetical protein
MCRDHSEEEMDKVKQELTGIALAQKGNPARSRGRRPPRNLISPTATACLPSLKPPLRAPPSMTAALAITV